MSIVTLRTKMPLLQPHLNQKKNKSHKSQPHLLPKMTKRKMFKQQHLKPKHNLKMTKKTKTCFHKNHLKIRTPRKEVNLLTLSKMKTKRMTNLHKSKMLNQLKSKLLNQLRNNLLKSHLNLMTNRLKIQGRNKPLKKKKSRNIMMTSTNIKKIIKNWPMLLSNKISPCLKNILKI